MNAYANNMIIFLEKLNDSSKTFLEFMEFGKEVGIQDNIEKVLVFLHSCNNQLETYMGEKVYMQNNHKMYEITRNVDLRKLWALQRHETRPQ